MFKRKRKFTGNLPEKKELSIDLNLKIHAPETYGDGKTVSSVVLSERGRVNTDTSIKQLKAIVDELFEQAYGRTLENIDESEVLTDGEHKRREEEKYNNDQI